MEKLKDNLDLIIAVTMLISYIVGTTSYIYGLSNKIDLLSERIDHLIKNENTRVEYLSDRVRKINPLEVQVEWLKNTCCSELIPTQKMSIEE